MLKRGKMVTLEPMGIEHIDIITKWHNDPVNYESQRLAMPMSKDEIRAFYEEKVKNNRDWRIFVIFSNEDSQPIGSASLRNINWVLRLAEFGGQIAEKAYRDGLRSMDFTLVVLDHAFNHLNLNKVFGVVSEHNTRLIGRLIAGGFQKEGELRDEVFCRGRYYANIYLAFFQKDFNRRYGTYFDDPDLGVLESLAWCMEKAEELEQEEQGC